MNINIIAGACGEINNQYIFSLLKNRDKTKNHIVIAPDRSQFSIEQRLFEETGEKCFFDINVISLSRLSKKVISNSKKNILTKQSGVALVKKILSDNINKLSVFNKATKFVGFASSLFETICFYKSCNVSPEEMFVGDSDSFSNLKQKDIKLIYNEYEKYLQNEFTDSFNQLKVFADNINSETFENTIFYFIEFDDFTRVMYDVLLKLSRFSGGIYISCSYGKEFNNSNIYSNKVYYDLIDLYKSENLNFKINKLPDFKDNTKNLLLHNLFSYSPEIGDITGANIDIKLFNNMPDEIKFVLADIYSKLIVNSCNLSQFAIIVPSINEYYYGIMQELKKYRILAYFDKSENLIENSYIRLVFDICNVIISDYRLFDFSAVIKSPILNFDLSEVSEIDNNLKRIGAIGDMCLNSQNITDKDIIDFVDLIHNIRTKVSNIESGADCIDIITTITDYINSRSSVYISRLNHIEERVYNQVLSRLDNINKDYISVFGNSEYNNFVEFLEIYKEYFASTSISMPPITSNTLFIADFNSSYVSKFDYIYILGNNEGKLPTFKLDNGLVSDEELSRLPNAKKLTPTVAMLNARKVFKLFDLCFKYNKELHLSFLSENFEGKLYPNNLIGSLNKIGNVSIENYSGVLDVINNSYFEKDTNNIVFNNLTQKSIENNLINYLSDWDVYNSNINYREIVTTLYNLSGDRTKTLVSSINEQNYIKKLSNIELIRHNTTSISQIETFYRCPYMHFVKYGLRLKNNTNTRMEAVDIGNIIHEVLSKLVPFIIKGDCEIDKVQEKSKTLLNEIISKEEYKDIKDNSENAYIIKALYREMERVTLAVFREIKISNFVPKYFEYKFNNVINIDGINVKGYIDRIDIYDDGFRIIDYKTGDNNFKNYNDLYSGKKLQLLLYANAFEKISRLNAKGVFYLPIMNGFDGEEMYTLNGVMLKEDSNIMNMDSGLTVENYKSNILHLSTTSKGKIKENSFYKNMCITKEDFNYILNFATKQVEKAIKNIRLGDITPYPLTEKNKCVCTHCEYKALCNYNNNNDNNIVLVEDVNKLKELNL